MTSRTRAAAVALFVVVVIALWVRHQHAREAHNRRLGELLAAASVKEGRRIVEIRAAAAKPMPEPARPCPLKTRVRVVRLESVRAMGGSLHEANVRVAEQREPEPWAYEIDVVDGRAYLFDYAQERVVCVGTDAEDPHGTLVAYDADAR